MDRKAWRDAGRKESDTTERLNWSELKQANFVAGDFSVNWKNIIVNINVKKLYSMFSSQTFMLPCLVFQSLSHFKLIIVSDVRGLASFHCIEYLFLQNHILKRLSLPIDYSWLPV